MNNVVDWLIIGRFGKAHGIKGQIVVHSFTDPRDNLMKYVNWHGLINKQWQPLSMLRLDATDKHILAMVEGYQDREQVAILTNVDIAVSREQLPNLSSGNYYWHELIGLKVFNKQAVNLGIVDEILPTGSNDVLIVKGEKRHLIPYLTEQVICHVDLEAKIILVDWDADF